MKFLLLFVLLAACLSASFAYKAGVYDLIMVRCRKSDCSLFFSDVCGLPHSRNGDGRTSCMGFMPSWSFDAQSGKCVEFIYGGCGGNANRFPDEQKCKETCL
ncbi:hypothetical protein KR222_003042 [Zaprionus bogoriensis]|nr:hypothetical protein KR222_003042 [Zaprionus bogoriensis]